MLKENYMSCACEYDITSDDEKVTLHISTAGLNKTIDLSFALTPD